MTGYKPTIVSRPGETLLELITEQGITLRDFCHKTKMSEDRVRSVLSGDETITRPMAESFAYATGVTTEFWLARQQHYDEYLMGKYAAKSQSN